MGCVPGGTGRNFMSYGDKIGPITEMQKAILCDPQTSGGLLLAITPESAEEAKAVARQHDIELEAIGELLPLDGGTLVEVC
jgi:selenide,water dikinase